MKIDHLEEGFFYHIYNRGNNSENIFIEEQNYAYFIKLMHRYVLPIADVYAYCLMKNHFHFLLRIKEKSSVKERELKYTTVIKPKVISASRQLSHFFNAYSQAVNKKYERTGSLFEKPFDRKRIEDEVYLKRLIVYVHSNPVNHGFCEKVREYKWSSFNAIISENSTKIKREEVIELFGGKENFIFCHENLNDEDFNF